MNLLVNAYVVTCAVKPILDIRLLYKTLTVNSPDRLSGNKEPLSVFLFVGFCSENG